MTLLALFSAAALALSMIEPTACFHSPWRNAPASWPSGKLLAPIAPPFFRWC